MTAKIKKAAVCALVFALAACSNNPPQSALDEMANALETHNSSKFLSRVDMSLYTANFVANMTENDQALKALNSLSGMLGLGSLDNLLAGLMNYQNQLQERFERGVANGELAAQCGESIEAGCPWTPDALRKARVTLVDDDAAVAAVTSPRGIISWLALRKENDVWKVVGLAFGESEARIFAKGTSKKQVAPPVTPVVPENEEKPAEI